MIAKQMHGCDGAGNSGGRACVAHCGPRLCWLWAGIVLLLAAAVVAHGQGRVGTAFTYQGQLKQSGSPITGPVDFQFSLWDALVGGSQVGSTVNVDNHNVVNGLFTKALDFGADAFTGDARWLEVAVRSPAGGGSFTTLSPRQELTPTPYALKVPGIDGHSLNAADGSPVDAVLVDNEGRVGIGTTSPTHPLHVETAGERAIHALNTSPSGSAYGVYAKCLSGEGTAVYGWASAPASGNSFGVRGRSDSCTGTGVFGEALHTGAGEAIGVLGHTMAPHGDAVSGIAWSTSGSARGVVGESHAPTGYGVRGDARGNGQNAGVYGESASGAGYGVHGVNMAPGGVAGFFECSAADEPLALKTVGDVLAQGSVLVRARNWPNPGPASQVLLGDASRGIAALPNQGVHVFTPGGALILAETGRVGLGIVAPAFPLHVETSQERAVYASNTAATGNAYGLYAECVSPAGAAVYGSALGTGQNYGVYAASSSGTGCGVYGRASTNGGIAGYFENGEGNSAPALKTIGDALVQGWGWPGGGVESRLLLGDSNHYIKSVAGQGVRIGTYDAVDLIRLQEGSGLVGIARTPTANRLEVEGDASKTTAGDWAANSDRRIKTDVQTVAAALDTLDRVRLVRFRYTDDYRAAHPGIVDREYMNVIAQEFAEVFPDYVHRSGEKLPDGEEILQVDPYPLTVYSAAAAQELHEIVKQKDVEIAAQADLIAAQQAQITDLQTRVERIEASLAGAVAAKKGDSR